MPESWIPPEHILELRSKVRLRKTLVDERSAWLQRIQAQLFHHGVPKLRGPAHAGAPRAARRARATRLRAHADRHSGGADRPHQRAARPLERELRRFARLQPGCLALQGHFGIGELTSVAILAELGDARRFSSSRHAAHFAGLDITVSQSDQRRAAGKLSHRGPPVLRWTLFEAARCPLPRALPRSRLLETRERLDGKQATLAVARKLIRRAHHTLRELGEEALQPVPAIT